MTKNKDNNFHTLFKINHKNKTWWNKDHSQELFKLLTSNKPMR